MKSGEIFKRLYATLTYFAQGDFRTLTTRLYKEYYSLLFFFAKKQAKLTNADLKVITEHKIAFESPDHIVPSGTKNDNSTNRAFILPMNKLLSQEFRGRQLKFLDLGCAGGQLVKKSAIDDQAYLRVRQAV